MVIQDSTYWFWLRDRTVKDVRDDKLSQQIPSSEILFPFINSFYKVQTLKTW